MKKILLYAVVLLTAIGCQKSPLDQENSAPSENLVSISIQAALSGSSDTRAAVTPDSENDAWKSSWETDDKLTLVDASGNVTTLETIEIDEDGIATFTGDVAVGEYEVYCVDKYTISSDGSLLVDYSAQVASDKCTKMPLKADSKLTVSDANTNDCTSLIFSHLAQVMELRVSFADIDAEYSVTSIEISGAQGDDADYYGFESAFLSFNDVTVSSNDELFSTYCYLPEFTIAKEGEITLQAKLDKGGNVYVAECSITNSTEADVVFEAGKHNYLTSTFGNLSIENWIDYAATSFVEGAYAGVASYTIETPEQLAYLAKLVNEGTPMTSVTFTLANDIDLSGKEFTTIGKFLGSDVLSGFRGIFNGGGYTVKGLYINQPSSSDYQGLFSLIDAATIKNVSVSGEVTGKDYVGGVVGWSQGSSSITNCYNSAVVEGVSYVGGVVGISSNASVTNCYNTATVNGSTNSIGGVVGHSSSSITNCYNTAMVYGKYNVGGLVGISEGSTITNCYWDNYVYSGNGIGYDLGTVTTVTAKTTSEMQSDDFVKLLNNNAVEYNTTNPNAVQACAWIAVSGGYPTLDFGGDAPSYALIGGGTEASPYQISSAYDLRQLSTNVAYGTTYSGKYFQMTQNIDLGGESNEFTAIGSSSKPFRGTFDGGGYTVSGLYIYQSSSSYQGLFGYIGHLTGATIKNLSVSGSVTGLSGVGGVVGYIATLGSSVTNCHNYCTVTANGVAFNSSVGGVVGDNSKSATITSCNNYGDVISSNCYTGGVVGNNSGTVTYCSNEGSISSTNTDSSDSIYPSIGGVVGYNTSTITYCYNSGEIEGEVFFVGGIAGNNKGTVTNCYNTASVEGTDIGTSYSDVNIASTGGIAGYNYGTTANCYSTGDVTGKLYTGGVVGNNDSEGLITNCYASGGTISNSSNFDYYCGGVAGFNNGASETYGTITNCYWDYSDISSVVGQGNTTSISGSNKVENMQDDSFVTLLNNGAYTYNSGDPEPSIKACAWTKSSSYPTLDFTNLSPEYTALE